MTVGEVFAGVPLKEDLPQGLARSPVAGIDYDSRRVGGGYLFFAFEGRNADGRRFALDAIQRGAIAVVSESPRPTPGICSGCEISGRPVMPSPGKTLRAGSDG